MEQDGDMHDQGRRRARKCDESHQHTKQLTQNNLAIGYPVSNSGRVHGDGV